MKFARGREEVKRERERERETASQASKKESFEINDLTGWFVTVVNRWNIL